MSRLQYPPRGSDYIDQGEIQRPVFGIDIDGTLGAYHEHFVLFAAAYLGRDLPDPAGYLGGVSFPSYLGLSKATYRRVKLSYRRGGLKRSMPALRGASDLSRYLRRRGSEVILCTTRPYLSLENVDGDTRHWVKRNRIQCDGITWGENKYKDLSRIGDRLVAVYDDDLDMVGQALACGVRAVVAARSYNTETFGVPRESLGTAAAALGRLLDEWEEQYR